MKRRVMHALPTLTAALAVALATASAALAGSSGLPSGWHECERPVVTGVEVHALHGVTAQTACPVALALFKWENKPYHAAKLYGCHRPSSNSAGTPYLRMHSFDGWSLSLTGHYRAFTMSRAGASFEVTGTDFPLNCS